jgi:hypothetical protein
MCGSHHRVSVHQFRKGWPTDAKRCRDNVTRCIELAKDAKDAETRSVLFELVKGWVEAAAKLDKIKHTAEALKKSLGQGPCGVARFLKPVRPGVQRVRF